jgi:hypothetical protein
VTSKNCLQLFWQYRVIAVIIILTDSSLSKLNYKINIFRLTKKYFLFNENTFWSTEKFSLVFRKIFSLLAVFVFRKVVSGKSLFKLSCVYLLLEKLVNGKHFPVKGKFGLVFRKVFSWKNLGGKNFPEVVKNLEMSLFADYIKFDPQTFDCYI